MEELGTYVNGHFARHEAAWWIIRTGAPEAVVWLENVQHIAAKFTGCYLRNCWPLPVIGSTY
jgi:hypothetical protein